MWTPFENYTNSELVRLLGNWDTSLHEWFVDIELEGVTEITSVEKVNELKELLQEITQRLKENPDDIRN